MRGMLVGASDEWPPGNKGIRVAGTSDGIDVLAIVVTVLVSVAAGVLAAAGVRRWPQADPARSAARAIGNELVRWRRVRIFLRSRLDPAATTGLALTVALIAVVLAGLVLGLGAYMIRTSSGVVRFDQSVARWAAVHVEGASFQVLRWLTVLGSTPMVVVVGIAGAIYGWQQRRSFSIPLFLVVVIGGQFLISNLIKFGVDRVRPDLGPFGALGTPSFPSGHSTAAAATYAALALVLARNRSPAVRALLAGVAVSIAVAVGCSRALLGVHWFSDVVAGLVLGWAWFAVAAVAFGGRILSYGAPVEEATSTARGSPRPVRSAR
jgi:membrane-associated phospholipid phosphatase